MTGKKRNLNAALFNCLVLCFFALGAVAIIIIAVRMAALS